MDKNACLKRNQNLELYLQKMETEEGDRMELARMVIARMVIADRNQHASSIFEQGKKKL